MSPFTYYRGAALPMASNLAATSVTGLAVQACGDAHVSNFGLFGSAEAPRPPAPATTPKYRARDLTSGKAAVTRM